MGMYTELHFNVELKRNVPQDIIQLLEYMVNGGDEWKHSLPDHELFKSDRWNYMLRCDSYYFSADTHSTIRLDSIAKSYFLCIRCNLKNYEDEIESFIDWVMPYIDAYPGDFLGFSRYEETEIPCLIHMPLDEDTAPV